ncbi:class I SAM-dependent methyltransferase [Paenibacillus tarimensis]|uniref:class I SAM-dependent methyltransferase n=1 Tax=Paenibacillus tarimensis TaxID=416012 RepID=UPI001F3D08F0|nr:class I SAM-dependent methyltransferase [Paenibacillus tarimensis]MCF2943460.1 class I SAM-dependent methyltransferase [Paenibacillus tarimensis]
MANVMGDLFAHWYDDLMRPLEKRRFQAIRKKLIGKAAGNVLEIGSGTGINFVHYNQADEVTAVEPDAVMREKSRQRMKEAPVKVTLLDSPAEKLPFADHTFDTVVTTLVLCTVQDPALVLQELHRVCKPEGRLLLFEHVRHDNRLLSAIQTLLTPLWKQLCGGCHLNRDTLTLVQQHGFHIVSTEQFYNRIFVAVEAAASVKRQSAQSNP